MGGHSFKKPCLKCGALIRGASYCGGCAPVKVDSPERKAKKKALYGGDYRRRAQAVKNSATHCHICSKPFEWGDTIEADHLHATPDSPLLPAHRTCNRLKGNKPSQ
jgi:hypothetical protein